MVIVTVSLMPKEGYKKAFIEHMKELTKTVSKEDGYLAYELYEDPFHAKKLFLFEKWESEKALHAHLATPHMVEHFEKTASWLEGDTLIDAYEAALLSHQSLSSKE